MSTVYADTVEPTVPTKDTTLGATGDSITIGANSINTNVIQDSGGNVLFQSDGSGTLSNVNSGFSADLKLLSTQTASGASNISFTSDIDSTYDLYVFKFISIHPSTEGSGVGFTFNGSIDSGSNYNVTKTTSYFWALHAESGASSNLEYSSGDDLAQSTAYQKIADGLGSGADECASGELYLFAPSSTTYVKHFYSRTQYFEYGGYAVDGYPAGYFNTTSAINGIDFKMDSGTFDGVIKMYGL